MEEYFKDLILYVNNKDVLTLIAELVTVFLFIITLPRYVFNEKNYFLLVSLVFLFVVPSALVGIKYYDMIPVFQIMIFSYPLIFVALYFFILPVLGMAYKSRSLFAFGLLALFVFGVVVNNLIYISTFINTSLSQLSDYKVVSNFLNVIVSFLFVTSVIKGVYFNISRPGKHVN